MPMNKKYLGYKNVHENQSITKNEAQKSQKLTF